MNSLVNPLTPADCDLRDFQFMPLDVVRLRDSDIAAVSSGDEFRCAVLLWCASWHQVPAASLPDDDVVLSQLAGFGRVVKEWKKVRDGALRGWIKCSDGRLYHPVVAEKANESWNSKLRHHYEKLMERTRKENKKRESENLELIKTKTFDDWVSAGMPSTFEIKDGGNKEFSGGKNKPSVGIPAENALKGEVREHKGNINKVIEEVDKLHGSEPEPETPSLDYSKNEPFSMHADWEPSPTFDQLARIAGLPLGEDTPVSSLREFKTYWITHPLKQRTQGEWEHAFIKSLKAEKMKGGGK